MLFQYYCEIEIVCAPISMYSNRLFCSFLTALFKEVVPGDLVTLAWQQVSSCQLLWTGHFSFIPSDRDISFPIYAILYLL